MISILTPSIRPLGLEVTQQCLARQTFQDFEWLVEIGIPEKGCDLSAAWNRMLRRAKGEWIVLLQDYIKIPKDGLERFIRNLEDQSLFTGSVGKASNLKYEEPEWDWRNYGKTKEVDYMHWEADWAIAPKKAFFDVGGFNEEYDQFWSSENVEIAFRMSKIGYKFFVMPNNRAVQYDHDKAFKHPFREKFCPEFHNANLDDIRMGKKPIKLNYL